MNISNTLKETIDLVLIILVNLIMAVQMISSLLIFVKNIVLLIKSNMATKVVPLGPESVQMTGMFKNTGT